MNDFVFFFPVLKTMSRYDREDEGALWVPIQECMSDEENIGDSMKIINLPWQSQALKELIWQSEDRIKGQNI